ncbi:hypothetical protein FPF71_04620 [Algibacter amylolyticus]|uniref:Lipoprotein n=1 Tax=Algibacter amylolyticus TaxID=1608400 RepID=A0A5M7BGZ4_9FLAO|nr:hypothetical protein [Algibacter amylolyticus]KAA5828123.1 hypothetical protein F2B50_04620 [Algibacter amylolyticus]MBB5267371.1 hypothetical protein [Algibacter amylolyticus]TSJ82368.1 hypothetical protein FPF71_04620 [Algibacter amylolyticus]
MKQKATYKITILLIVMLCLFFGCKSSNSSFKDGTVINGSPKVLFLNYTIEKDLNRNRTIQFINKKVVEASLKKQTILPIDQGVEGDLILSELNKRSKIVKQQLIKNPLARPIEFVDDSKKFKTEVIKTDKAQFSIRLQLQNSTKYITISNFAKNTPLIKTQIK